MLPPTSPTVGRFLRRSLIARIATLSPAGNPDIIPLYFVVHRQRVYMGTRAENPTVRDLLRSPQVVLLFHGEQTHSGRVLRVEGRAAFRTERGAFLPVYARMALKYWLSPGGAWNTLTHLRKLALDRRYKAERVGGGGLIEVELANAEFLRLPT